jgi:1-acyl-sn-glycerol-3-phosphate acyltransferase
LFNIFRLVLIGLWIEFVSFFALLFAFIDRSYRLYFLCNGPFSNGILKLAGIKYETSGMENIEKGKAYIYVSNHSSQFDISVLQSSIPGNVSMYFKKELAKIPLFGWQLWAGPYVMIDRKNPDSARRSLEKAKWLLNERKVSVLLFAEGTRSETGEIQQFKRGAFNLAGKVGFPIIPVSISGSHRIMQKGSLKINPGIIRVHFDKPISTENINTRQDEIDLMNKVREIIIKNHSMD